MSVPTFNPGDFTERFRFSLLSDPLKFRITKVKKDENIYAYGDQGRTIYFIEAGYVKLLMLSPEGRECILAIYARGDTFGESCLIGTAGRQETATALEHTTLRRIPCHLLFSHLNKHSLIEQFMKHLIARIVEQQQLLAHLTTLDSEHMLAWIILLLGRKLGRSDPPRIKIDLKITHEELSAMVGTTRPRITTFMRRFKNLGLIEVSSKQFLIIHEQKLSDYLARFA